jgi:hypothetical protein
MLSKWRGPYGAIFECDGSVTKPKFVTFLDPGFFNEDIRIALILRHIERHI